MRVRISIGEARRIALAAQGFDRPRPPRPPRARDIAAVIRRLGLLQIDTVSVVARSQDLVLFSRLGVYDRALAARVAYGSGEFTEQWAHEAAIIPVETWPLLGYRMENHRVRPYPFAAVMKKYPEYIASVLEEVRARGPLGARDLEPASDGMPGRLIGCWHDSPQRATLEAHFGRGLLAVTKRDTDFSRIFDLAERVIPQAHYGRRVSREEADRELLLRAARAHGVGTAADLADYYRMPVRDARPRIAELVEAGEVREVQVEGWRESAYLHREARAPREIAAASLLSPFDPVVWYRPRAERLFDFDYRLEIFVPAAKRRWGYYVLPFLLGERLAARVDLRTDRVKRRLLVLAKYIENGVKAKQVAAALSRELQTMAQWLGLDGVELK